MKSVSEEIAYAQLLVREGASEFLAAAIYSDTDSFPDTKS
jgi:hypothetical protein